MCNHLLVLLLAAAAAAAAAPSAPAAGERPPGAAATVAAPAAPIEGDDDARSGDRARGLAELPEDVARRLGDALAAPQPPSPTLDDYAALARALTAVALQRLELEAQARAQGANATEAERLASQRGGALLTPELSAYLDALQRASAQPPELAQPLGAADEAAELQALLLPANDTWPANETHAPRSYTLELIPQDAPGESYGGRRLQDVRDTGCRDP